MSRVRSLFALPGAKVWITGARRRPGRGLAVVLGLVAMHAATVAALVGGSALETLFITDALAQWGTVDVVTFQPGEPLIGESTVRFAGTQADTASLETADQSVLARWGSRLELSAVAAGAPGRREPEVRVMGVSAEDVMLDRPLTGEGTLDPLLLGPQSVLVNRRLAGRLDVGVGDSIDLVVAVPEHTDPEDEDLTYDERVVQWRPVVEGIADDTGLADFGRTPNVITRMDTLQREADVLTLVSALYVTAHEPGRDAAEEVTRAFESINRRLGLVSVEAKEDALDIARDEGGLFSGILTTLALLVVAAGSVVTGNLIILLGQQRAREVALLRAVGARQQQIRRLFTLEAVLYALVAAVMGVAIALPLAGLLAGSVADNFASIEAGRGRDLVDLELSADPVAIASGVLVVVVIALLTARSAARRLGGLDVGDVLRGGPPLLGAFQGGVRRAARTQAAGLLLLGMGLTATDAGDLLRFMGLSLMLIAWWLRRRHAAPPGPERLAIDEQAAWFGLAWSVIAPALLGDFSKGVQSGFGVLTLAGLGAVTSATVLASGRMPQVMRALRVYLPGSGVQAPLKAAGAYAGHLRGRSGTVIGTIAIVLYMVASLAVLGSATDIGTARQRGGYDVIGTSAVEVDADRLSAIRGAARIDLLEHTLMGEGWFSTEAGARDERTSVGSVPYPVRAIEVTPQFNSVQAFTLVEALPSYISTAQVLDDVMGGDGVVIDRYARPEGAKVGDDVVIDDGRGPVSHRLLGVLDTFVLQGVLMGPDDYDDLFSRRGPTLVLATAAQGADPADLAAEVAEVGADRGMAVRPVSQAAAEVVAINRSFTDTFGILLRLGLAVALVAVAVLVARAVRERRGALAMLRAVGFTRRDVTIMLIAEPLLQALVGVVLGVGVGLGVLFLLFTRGFSDLAFIVGWAELGLTSLGVMALVGLCAYLPARVGARRDAGLDLRDLG